MLKTYNFTSYQARIDNPLAEVANDQIIQRIWAGDFTVWKSEPTEISNRLGWLRIAGAMRESIAVINDLVSQVRTSGYTQCVLLGMGGSSLAPEVFRSIFGVTSGFLDLLIQDSTQPDALLSLLESLELSKTLFIVSTKSGGTVETFSFFRFFYNQAAGSLGEAQAGDHFIAITDPGSKLAEIAGQYHFRTTFLNNPNIGGRYSALSFFGLVPAALLGVNIEQILSQAIAVGTETSVEGNQTAAQLGVILAELAKIGRDKLTLVTSPSFTSFGDWVEQLIAESTGKEGTGILPVVNEKFDNPDVYGEDRLFVYLRMAGESQNDLAMKNIQESGQPLVLITLNDKNDLGSQFFIWEMATAIAGYRLGINPFDQPNVESAKILARQMVAEYQAVGKLPEQTPILITAGIRVYSEIAGSTHSAVLQAALGQLKKGDYVTLQAYLQPTPETTSQLQIIRSWIQSTYQCATTFGYGPRFLHSTGQLHKGDRGNGVFIQFTSDYKRDAAIPDTAGQPQSTISFGTLIKAQALGDGAALRNANRRVIRFHLIGNIPGELRSLINL